MESPYLFKTKPNYLFMAFMIAGVVFFVLMANLSWPLFKLDELFKEVKTLFWVHIIVLFVFLGFSCVCLILAIAFKVIFLTTTEVIISTPLFFYKRTILINEIIGISDKDERIAISNSISYDSRITIGHNTTLRLKDGKKAAISSLQVWDYNELVKKIHTQTRICSNKSH